MKSNLLFGKFFKVLQNGTKRIDMCNGKVHIMIHRPSTNIYYHTNVSEVVHLKLLFQLIKLKVINASNYPVTFLI